MRKRELTIKTPDEIEKLARGGKILRATLEDIAALARPGVTGAELDAEAEKRLRAAGAEPAFKGYAPSGDPDDAFPATLCVSVNDAVVHGVPTATPFADGDIVSLDLGCKFEGLYTDTALTVAVGSASPEKQRLLDITRKSLSAAIGIVRPGVTTGDIGATVQRLVEREGFSVVRDLVGHGVGYDIHEEPSVPNFGKPGEGVSLPEGAVIAIEPMVVMDKNAHVDIAPDGWTVVTTGGAIAAHEELTIVVTARGARVLTQA